MSQKSNSYVAIFLTTKKKKSQDACYFFHCYIIEYLVKKVRYMEIKYEREKLIVEGIIHSFFFFFKRESLLLIKHVYSLSNTYACIFSICLNCLGMHVHTNKAYPRFVPDEMSR